MSDFVQAARQYIGVPYKHRGRSIRGMDCVGLPRQALIDCGKKMPDDFRLYGREPHKDGLMERLISILGSPAWRGRKKQCRREQLAVGDLIVIAFVAEPHHLAIVADDAMHGLSILHADGSIGVKRVIERGLTDSDVGQIVAIFRGFA